MLPTATATPTPTLTPTPLAAPAIYYLSASASGTVQGFAYQDEDILGYDTTSGTWTTYFDGTDVGLSSVNVDAFELMSDGSILLSLNASLSIAGLGTVTNADIIRFTPTSLGDITAGSFSWYFDGSDVGLTQAAENIDAISFAPDGRLLFSTSGNLGVTGVSAVDEDITAFTPTQLGATTSGSFTWYFDGSDVGLATNNTEDTDGLWADPLTGKLYLSTEGAYAVTGLSGDGADIFICTPGTLGATTSCTFGPGIFFDGTPFGFTNFDGVSVRFP